MTPEKNDDKKDAENDAAHEDLGFGDPLVITLSPEDFDAFLAAIENPPAPNARLIDLMKRAKSLVGDVADDVDLERGLRRDDA